MSDTSPIASLRALLIEQKIDYFLLFLQDAHLSEYIASRDAYLTYITGFNGSAGFALVGTRPGDNYFWTDGRYWLQAEQQLDLNEWHLMRSGKVDVLPPLAQLMKLVPTGGKVVVDPNTITIKEFTSFQHELISKSVKFEMTQTNLVDSIWPDRPPVPLLPNSINQSDLADLAKVAKTYMIKLPLAQSGQDSGDKVAQIVQHMHQHSYNTLVLTALDEIAWLLNLRGADIDHNPVFFSYLLIRLDPNFQASMDAINAQEKDQSLYQALTPFLSMSLFINIAKVDLNPTIRPYLEQELNIELIPYELFYKTLQNLPSVFPSQRIKSSIPSKSIISLDFQACNYHVYSSLKSNPDVVILDRLSYVSTLKAIKNEIQLEGMRQSHLQDGAALVEFFHWLSIQIQDPKLVQQWDEYSLAMKELEFRQQRKDFVNLSFQTISSVGPNAAVIHYGPKKDGSRKLARESIYLNDSGGQYLNGTTDVTRTWHFGEPTLREKQCYTCVLKGFLSLSKAKFPPLTSGYVLDALARAPIWAAGLNFAHGVGHGVGHYLNVHETPPRITGFPTNFSQPLPLSSIENVQFKPNMITSIEPGYYEDGAFGIRIENLAITRSVFHPTPSTYPHLGQIELLEFEQITMVPIDLTLVDQSMLQADEIAYLNDYHEQVWQKISPLVHESAQQWLRQRTLPI